MYNYVNKARIASYMQSYKVGQYAANDMKYSETELLCSLLGKVMELTERPNKMQSFLGSQQPNLYSRSLDNLDDGGIRIFHFCYS